MARKKQETLVLFPELIPITRKFTDEQFGILIRAVFAYRFSGEMYEGDDMAIEVAFQTVANQIERYSEFCQRQSQNAKGGEDNSGAAECSQSTPEEAEEDATESEEAEASRIQPGSAPIQSMSMSISNPCPIQSCERVADEPPRPPKEKLIRHKYGEYKNVLLSDDELAKLQEEIPGLEAKIDRLSEYIASSGKKYKSHYATLRAWVRRDAREQKYIPIDPDDGLDGIL